MTVSSLDSRQCWWADVWRNGWISLPEKLIENLWYAEGYKMASCSRKEAPGQLGHCSGDYHTNIIQQAYWPIYCANRQELGWPSYDLNLGMLEYIVEDTACFTGQPGARFVRGLDRMKPSFQWENVNESDEHRIRHSVSRSRCRRSRCRQRQTRNTGFLGERRRG